MDSFKDVYGNTVQLTFDSNHFIKPGHVLIIPIFKNRLVLTKHHKRGIELPGGKIEADETPLAAAVREVFEETGASLSSITLIGQYTILLPKEKMVKSIFKAEVETLIEIPFSTDTLGPVLLEHIPVDVKSDPTFSPYMKDEVYPRILHFLNLI